ncbi:MAG: hypothetical protein ACOYVF_11180, partial [Candidatus Zixiibacteriota bacterium]
MRKYLFAAFIFGLLVLNAALVLPRDNRDITGNINKELNYTITQGADYDSVVCYPADVGLHITGEVDASFNCYGQFGTGFNYFPGNWPSFISPSGSQSQYLFGGTVWIGGIIGSDTLVSVGADGWQRNNELFSTTYPEPSVTKRQAYLYIGYPPTDSISILTYRAEYCDTFTSGVPNLTYDYMDGRNHLPLNVRVAMRSYSYAGGPTSKAVIYDMVITNIGGSAIQSGYLGFYFDADVMGVGASSGFLDDITGSLPDDTIAYIIDDDGGLYSASEQDVERVFAFKFLRMSFTPAGINYNWWISNASAELDFGPRQKEVPFRDFGTGGLGTPEGDRNKFYIMSHPEWDYDQIFTSSISAADPDWMYPNQTIDQDVSNGFDARFLMSIGPFNLESDSSARVIFTTFTGEDVHVDPNNAENNLHNAYLPATYLSNLDFSDLTLVANYAGDFMNNYILTPLTAQPQGLSAALVTYDSVKIQWDPWVFDDVTGYEIYLSEIPSDSIPHPGVVPPWL